MQKILILIPLEAGLMLISLFAIIAGVKECRDEKLYRAFLVLCGIVGFVIMFIVAYYVLTS